MFKAWLSWFILISVISAGAEPDFKALGQRALSLSQQYIRLKSINPPADTRATAAFMQHLLKSEGIEVKLFESAPNHFNVLARLRGKQASESLLLLNHMDVVPADASRWPVDPFAAVIKDGFLYGRGAIDMKTTGIFQALTLIALKREKLALAQDVILLCSADEESGGEQGALWMIKHHWPEIECRYALDEGGFGSRDMLAASGALVFGVSVAEKKVLWARLTATGSSGHGSQPVSDSANDRLRHGLNRLEALMKKDPWTGSPILNELYRRCGILAGNKFTAAIQHDTMSITSLRAGVGEPPKVNVIPSKAQATLDFRLLPDTEVEPFLKRVRASLSEIFGLELEILHVTDPTPVSDYHTPLFGAIEQAVLQEYPQAIVTPYLVPFGTDSNSLRQKGVRAYGFGTAVINASIVASMHSDAERIPVDQFEPGMRIYYRAVAGYAHRP